MPRAKAEAKPDLSYIAEQLRGLAVPVADCCPDPDNVNTHGVKNLAAINGSLEHFDQTKPVVGRHNEAGQLVIYAGNGLLNRARHRKWSHIAVVIRDDWTAEHARAYALADNQTAHLAEFDDEALAAQLKETDERLRRHIGFDDADYKRRLVQFEAGPGGTGTSAAKKHECPECGHKW